MAVVHDVNVEAGESAVTGRVMGRLGGIMVA